MNNHDDIRKLLAAYCGGDLKEAELRRIKEHLAGCAACRAELTDLQTVQHLLKTTPEAEPPPWLATRVMALVREQQNKRSWLQRLFFPLHIKLPIEVMALLLVCVSGYYMARNIETELQQPAIQQELPATVPEPGKPAAAPRQEAPAVPDSPVVPPDMRKEPAADAKIAAQPSAPKATNQAAPRYVPEAPTPSPQAGFAPAPLVRKEEASPRTAEAPYSATSASDNSVHSVKRAKKAVTQMNDKAAGSAEHGMAVSEAPHNAAGAPAATALPQVKIRLNMFAPALAPASLKEVVIRSEGSIIADSFTQRTSFKARIPAGRMDALLEQLGRLGKIVERPQLHDIAGIIEIEIIW